MRKLAVTELGRIDVEQFKSSRKLPLTIILDDVRRTATPQNSLVEIHKTALGAEESVEWLYSDDCVSVVKELNEKGYVTVAVEQVEGSDKLDSFSVEPGRSYALVLGNEVKGVNQKVVDICQKCLEIPQYGTKHSLNVSVTAGLVIWEFYKQLKDLL